MKRRCLNKISKGRELLNVKSSASLRPYCGLSRVIQTMAAPLLQGEFPIARMCALAGVSRAPITGTGRLRRRARKRPQADTGSGAPSEIQASHCPGLECPILYPPPGTPRRLAARGVAMGGRSRAPWPSAPGAFAPRYVPCGWQSPEPGSPRIDGSSSIVKSRSVLPTARRRSDQIDACPAMHFAV